MTLSLLELIANYGQKCGDAASAWDRADTDTAEQEERRAADVLGRIKTQIAENERRQSDLRDRVDRLAAIHGNAARDYAAVPGFAAQQLASVNLTASEGLYGALAATEG